MSGLSSRSAASTLRDPILLGIVAVAVALRAAAITHGLPEVYNPDETAIMNRALALGSGDLNPHNFLYPSLYFYVLAATTGLWMLVSMAFGLVPSMAAFEAAFWRDPTQVYVAARLLSVLAGTAAVAVVYRLARTFWDRQAGLAAAALMAVAYVPVRDAHFVKHDVPLTLLVLLTAAAAVRVWRRPGTGAAVAAGALAGVSAACQYYGALALAPVVVADILQAGSLARSLGRARIWFAVAIAAATFVVCSPYVVLDYATAWRDISQNRAIIVDRAREAFGTFGSARVQLRLLAELGAGWPWLAAAAAGAVLLWNRSRQACLLWAAFPISFALLIANTWPFARTANPLYPFLAVAGGIGLSALADRLPRPALALAAVTALAAAFPATLSARLDWLLAQPDTRTTARHWVEGRVPASSTVLIDPYSVPLVPDRSHLVDTLRRNGVAPAAAGRQVRMLLSREPYPAPAYRVFYLGQNEVDRERRYLAPDAFGPSASADRTVCLDYLILKSRAPTGDHELAPLAARRATLVHRESPFRASTPGAAAFLPDFDVRPGWSMVRPGPHLEIWRATDWCVAEDDRP